MRYFIYFVPFLAGCSFLEQVAEEAEVVSDAAGPVIAERGSEIVDKIGDVASGDPTAIVAAAVAVVGAVGLIIKRYVARKKAAK